MTVALGARQLKKCDPAQLFCANNVFRCDVPHRTEGHYQTEATLFNSRGELYSIKCKHTCSWLSALVGRKGFLCSWLWLKGRMTEPLHVEGTLGGPDFESNLLHKGSLMLTLGQVILGFAHLGLWNLPGWRFYSFFSFLSQFLLSPKTILSLFISRWNLISNCDHWILIFLLCTSVESLSLSW